ncbi:hypothetical protein POTOM_014288 [Populus tomentosa]|uniref:Amidohydrolase-related domain-containing protein n=1 Tax=Populus tomentosa TaxID=118781 RepID=A0A8X8A2A7_POPTO|nr:hypothetical protein POTOM_014288 [Populus tomentosa]
MSMTCGQWLLKPLVSAASTRSSHSSHSYLSTVSVFKLFTKETPTQVSAARMATGSGADNKTNPAKVIDSHLHVWASPEEAAGKYPYFPGQEPTLRGDLDFLLQSLEEAGVDGALIVQPINHKFDHSLVTSVLKKYPNKFVGCCLANPAEDGSGLKHLEELILKDGYRAVRFNPYLWPSGEKMTNDIGKALFSKAGELGVPVGFMCMKGLNLHISEIQELCTEFPSTVVLLDHLSFCKPPTNDEESFAFSELLKLSKFPQGVKNVIPIPGSGPPPLPSCFELWREPSHVGQVTALSIIFPITLEIGERHAQKHQWLFLTFSFRSSDFPYVVPECGYKGGKEAVLSIANQVPLSSSELEWIMGKTVMQLFRGQWVP